jgi:hypothetical protein
MNFDKQQGYADDALSRIRRARNVPVGQRLEPGDPYQQRADGLLTMARGARNISTPYTPIERRAQGSQDQANGFLNRMIDHDDLQLSGLVRRSGSLARATRIVGLGTLGDTAPVATSSPIDVYPAPVAWYQNPYYLAGIGTVVGGGLLWLALRKKR